MQIPYVLAERMLVTSLSSSDIVKILRLGYRGWSPEYIRCVFSTRRQRARWRCGVSYVFALASCHVASRALTTASPRHRHSRLPFRPPAALLTFIPSSLSTLRALKPRHTSSKHKNHIIYDHQHPHCCSRTILHPTNGELHPTNVELLPMEGEHSHNLR